MCHANRKQKKAGVHVLKPNEVNVKAK
jgi:hypothetical protein